MNKKKLKESIKKAWIGIYNTLPILVGVILLISLITTNLDQSKLNYFFQNNYFIDSIIANLFGSILAGNPINSYVLGGELLKSGVSLFVITTFIVSWVTVGLIQFPAESILLGKKFAIIRNISAFFLSFIVAILTIMVVSLL